MKVFVDVLMKDSDDVIKVISDWCVIINYFLSLFNSRGMKGQGGKSEGDRGGNKQQRWQARLELCML